MNFDDSGRTIAEDVMFSGLSEFPLPPAVVTLRSGLRRIVLRLLQQSGSENDHSNSNSSSDLDTRDSIICVAYICLLTCCCLTPCLYFLRISAWHRRRMRQLRDLERAGIVAALAQSYLQHYQNNNDGDHNNNITRNEAVHAERKALILKLLEPVQMTLLPEHFFSAIPTGNDIVNLPPNGGDVVRTLHKDEEWCTKSCIGNNNPVGCGDDTTWNVTTTKCKTTCPDETLSDATSCSESSAENPPPTTTVGTTNIKNATTRCHIEDECGFDHEEESILIQIPLPGLVLKHRVEHSINKCSTENNPSTFTKTTMCTTTARIGTARLVPGFCTICLSGFTVGSNICWSSNSQCEHCFHCDCIEEWITKQLSSSKTNPVCPCCRRDFIVDSHDLSMPLSSPPPPVIIPTNTSTESLSTDQNSVTQDDIYDNDTSSIDQGTSNRPADRAEAEDFDIVVSLPVSLAGNNSRSISVENGSFEVQAQQNLGQQPTSSELSSHNVSGGDASDEESI